MQNLPRNSVWIGVLLAGLVLSGCPQKTPKPTRGTKEPAPLPAPSPMRAGQPTPSPVAPRGGGCEDKVLVEAFAKLSGCNYQKGIIDYQCKAWQSLHKLISQRERNNQALVQLTLMQLLEKGEERARLVAAKSLFNYARQTAVIGALSKAYGSDQSAYVRVWIVYSLHAAAARAVQTVLKALESDTDVNVRAKAAQRLNLTHHGKQKRVVEALTGALKGDKSIEVRKKAAESLGALRKGPEMEKLLLGCLKDDKIGPHCAMGLGRMGSRAGYEAIGRILEQGAKTHTVHPLYVWTVLDFYRHPFFRPARVIALLRGIALDKKMPTGSRHYAVKALGRLGRSVPGQKGAIVRLLKPLQTDKVLSLSARPTLAQLTGKKLPPPPMRPAMRPAMPAPMGAMPAAMRPAMPAPMGMGR